MKKNEIIFEIVDLDNSEEISNIDIGARLDTLYDLINAGYVEKVEEQMGNISFIEKFKKYNVNPENIGFYNIGWKYVFKNGYGASVIDDGYGGDRGLYEVAVLKKITEDNYELCYETEITDDVVGFLNNEGVIDILERIKNLKSINKEGKQ